MEHALGILKKTPPSDIGKTLNGLKLLMGSDGDSNKKEQLDQLLKRVYLPFEVMENVQGTEKPFLLTRYNKVGGGSSSSYRSPWTQNIYSKPDMQLKSKGSKDDSNIRELEARANEVWDAYRNLYYGFEAIGSVYLQRKGTNGLQGLFGICKNTAGSGAWHSVHIVTAEEPVQDGRNDLKCTYHIESTVLLILYPDIYDDDEEGGQENTQPVTDNADMSMNISATITKNTSKTLPILQKSMIDTYHIENIGTIIEDIEIELRSNLEQVHIPRTKEVVDAIQADDHHKLPHQNQGINPLVNIMEQSKFFQKKKAEQQNN